MVLAGRDVMREPLKMRRGLLETKILPKLSEPVRYAGPLDASLPVLIESVKAQGLEGLVAKRLDSRYETGLRSGALDSGQGCRTSDYRRACGIVGRDSGAAMAPAGPSGKYSDANRELSSREHERHIDPQIAAVRISCRA